MHYFVSKIFKYLSVCNYTNTTTVHHPSSDYIQNENYDFLFSFILDAMLCDVRCRFNLTHKVF